MPKRGFAILQKRGEYRYLKLYKSIDNAATGTLYFKSKANGSSIPVNCRKREKMSMTLGEKLRQAREERGITLSEVAEQTRISPQYIESIEHDDYRSLPGGIFNKGFVKSFAKYVGVNEQEALADYSDLITESTATPDDEFKAYKPEVLTDYRTGSSMVPTVIGAVVILALMTGGILFLVNYLRQPAAPPANTAKASNSNSANNAQTDANPTPSNVPDMATLKVEFKAVSQPVSLTAISDGKTTSNVVTAGSSAIFEPKESLKLSYSRSLAQAVQLTINSKNITLPSVPLVPKRNIIEFEINKENIGQIWQSGAISSEVPPANPEQNNNVVTAPPTSVPTPVKPTPQPKPNVTANTAANSTNKPKPTPTVKPQPMLKSTVIPIPPANRPH